MNRTKNKSNFPDYPPLDETGMVDLWQIEANLAMTPAQRIQKFMRFLELQNAIRKAGTIQQDVSANL